MTHYLIIGNCGVGKTYVLRKLLSNMPENKPQKLGQVFFHEAGDVGILGKYVGGVFDGSDRLSMSVAADFPKLHRYAKANHVTLIGEGDRFMNKTFIGLFAPVVLHIQGTGEEGRARRGSAQTERQLKSIATRVSNIQAHYKFKDSEACYQFLKQAISEALHAND
jgi:hypothetical protein